MENKTRFDLKSAIADWRTTLSASESITPEQERELESHLQENIATLKLKGVDEEDAFFLSTRRLGPPNRIAVEFEKQDPLAPWRLRLFWMLIGVMAFHFLSTIGGTLATLLATTTVEIATRTLFETDPKSSYQVFWVAQFVGTLASPIALYFLSKHKAFSWLAVSRARLALSCSGLLIAAYFSSFFANMVRAYVLTPSAQSLFPFNWDLSWMFVALPFPIILAALAARVMPERLIQLKQSAK